MLLLLKLLTLLTLLSVDTVRKMAIALRFFVRDGLLGLKMLAHLRMDKKGDDEDNVACCIMQVVSDVVKQS